MDDQFSSLNAGYITELYERYQKDPESVDSATRDIFKNWTPPFEPAVVPSDHPLIRNVDKVVQAANYANALRAYGHLASHLYPIGHQSPGDPSLELKTYQMNEADLEDLPASVVGGPVAEDAQNALEAIRALRNIYTTSTGYDYGHVEAPEEREWLRWAAECGQFRAPSKPLDEETLLEQLTQVEVFENFLHRFFPGKTRFSIEGVDILVPMLDEIVQGALETGICMVMIGMAHRGRLNVLAHILSKPYQQILAEFKDQKGSQTLSNETGWTGDVKYHKGASRAFPNDQEVRLVVWLPPNPSHLEHVNPVIEGMVRAAQSKVDQAGKPILFAKAALPVLIHGDAAFPGEGVVAETLNLSRLEGYGTSGTIHIIANNQLGFTTPPEQERSTLYASDLAKGFEIPVIHVNADDPPACIEAVRTAIAYREEFHKDFLIDLIGYRRYGHNEGDEPGFTQPVLYEQIHQHPTVRKIWADHLIENGKVTDEAAQALTNRFQEEMQNALDNLSPDQPEEQPLEEEPAGGGLAEKTAIPLEMLDTLNQEVLKVPDDFHLNPKLERGMQRRKKAFQAPDDKAIDWAAAEELALATILVDGIPIRLTGQDVERGTFSQRHAVFFDINDNRAYVPLEHINEAKAAFEVCNSPLSENAAVGFEYGYNVFDPERLDIWEAQYGDFINSAQAMVDEFLVSGRAKWGQLPSLVLLLPHSYEGQGPDHSSGRMERFLQLANRGNIRIVNCTSAAQYFHLLRLHSRQIRSSPRPLIVFTPKSLLRHPQVASSLRELSEGVWKPVLDDETVAINPKEIERIILCTGKIAIELLESKLRVNSEKTAILRLEQLYPFPKEGLMEMFHCYPAAKQIDWVQEEPENMGAWMYLEPRIGALLDSEMQLGYIGRAASSSPAEGSLSWHNANQEALIAQALERKAHERSGIIMRSKR